MGRHEENIYSPHMRHVEQTKTRFHPSLAWWANEFLGSLSKEFLVKTCVTQLQKSPPSVGDNLGIPHSNNSLQDLQAAPPGSPLLLSNCLLWIPPWGIALTTFHLPELYESCKLHELPKPHNSVSFSSLQSLTPQPGKKPHQFGENHCTMVLFCVSTIIRLPD